MACVRAAWRRRLGPSGEIGERVSKCVPCARRGYVADAGCPGAGIEQVELDGAVGTAPEQPGLEALGGARVDSIQPLLCGIADAPFG